MAVLGLSLWSVDRFAEAEKKLRKAGSVAAAAAAAAGDDATAASGKRSRQVALALVLCTRRKYDDARKELEKTDVKFVKDAQDARAQFEQP